MFDDLKDSFSKLTIARLQKRIDVLKAHQERLEKFTTQRSLNELEHYRLQLSIGVASITFFGTMAVVGFGFALTVNISHFTGTEKSLTVLVLLLFFLILIGIWESNCVKTIKYWSAASPINRAELQRRIIALEEALTQHMAKRFGWSTK